MRSRSGPRHDRPRVAAQVRAQVTGGWRVGSGRSGSGRGRCLCGRSGGLFFAGGVGGVSVPGGFGGGSEALAEPALDKRTAQKATTAPMHKAVRRIIVSTSSGIAPSLTSLAWRVTKRSAHARARLVRRPSAGSRRSCVSRLLGCRSHRDQALRWYNWYRSRSDTRFRLGRCFRLPRP